MSNLTYSNNIIGIGCGSMLKVDPVEIEALVEVTEQFVEFAETLLSKGEITQEEYDSMTVLKKQFLEDIRIKYF